VIVWADEKHTAKEVTRQIRDATGVEWQVAEQYAKDIEERVSLGLAIRPLLVTVC
jgi:E3 ubiquitin-protein ligase UBR1